jgi:hypothetical protein
VLVAKGKPTDTKAVVLRSVRESEIRPLELMETLSKKGYSSTELKRVLAQMLHDGQLELTAGRVLRTSAGA